MVRILAILGLRLAVVTSSRTPPSNPEETPSDSERPAASLIMSLIVGLGERCILRLFDTDATSQPDDLFGSCNSSVLDRTEIHIWVISEWVCAFALYSQFSPTPTPK